MTETEHVAFPADDARLVYLSIPDSGWSADQTLLSERDIETLRGLIRRPILVGAEAMFSRYLRRIFANAVVAETIWRSRPENGGGSVLCASYPSSIRPDRKAKLSTIVREELRILRDRHRDARDNPGGDGTKDFARRLDEANPATRRLIELVMLGHGTLVSSIEGLYRAKPISDNDYVALGHAIDEGLITVAPFVKSSSHEPASRQMARGLAGLYRHVTGEHPRRINRNVDSVREGQDFGETGDFLDLCRHMAGLLNAALPTDLRRPRPADMAKAARKAKAELEKETCATR